VPTADVLNDLRAALANSKLVPMVGAGVSVAAAGLPSWRRLIENGIEYSFASGGWKKEDLTPAYECLASDSFTEAACKMKALLGAPSGQYSAWLEEVFGITLEDVVDKEVPNAIVDLLCPVIATTNYDLILEHMALERVDTVTWREPSALLRALRVGHAVMHLHGCFNTPESVILGADNYNELVSDSAYLAVMRSLWIEHTFLFIGCSFDGLQDPDFNRMIEWFVETFRGTSHRHYALMLEGSFTLEQQRNWLHKFRVQVIPYGPTHSDLGAAISSLNVNLMQAQTRRYMLAKRLLEGRSSLDRGRFLSVLEGVIGAEEGGGLAQAATALFAERTNVNADRHDQLSAMQMLIRSQMDVQTVVVEMKAWKRGKTKFVGRFRDIVRQAAGMMLLVPDELLNALKRRGIHIHKAVLDGSAKRLLEYLETHSINAELTDELGRDPFEDYAIENANRILITLSAILDAVPGQIFPVLKVGTTTAEELEEHLIVVRQNSVEIRRWDFPSKKIAKLPSDLKLEGGSVQRLFEKNTVIVFTHESVIAWDPAISSTIAEVSVSVPYGINSVDHWNDGEKLCSVAATISGPIFYLENMKQLKVLPGPEGSFITDIALLPDHRIYGLVNGFMNLVCREDEQWVEVLNSKTLETQIMECPVLRSYYTQRNDEASKWFGTLWDRESGIGSRFENPTLKHSTFFDKDFLILSVQVSFDTSDTLVLLLDPTSDQVKVAGHFLKKSSRIADLEIVQNAHGTLRLFCALLSDFQLSYDLVIWATGARTKNGIIFVEAGSTIRMEDDMIRVGFQSPDRSFAADDSGGLFLFSSSDRSWEEIDRQESRIRDLIIVGSQSRERSCSPLPLSSNGI
jgi:hypothetical protein